MPNLEETLLKAARESGWSMKHLAEQAKLNYCVVHGFMKSGRVITIRSAGRLAEALGLGLTPVRQKRKGGE